MITAFRIGVVVLLAFAVSAEIANVIYPRSQSPALAIAAGLIALVGFAVYAALGLESRLFAHRVFAHRLWQVAERYRALLSEVNDERVDPAALIRRRDELVADLDAVSVCVRRRPRRARTPAPADDCRRTRRLTAQAAAASKNSRRFRFFGGATVSRMWRA